MDKRISMTDHQGYRILIADFSGIQSEAEYMTVFDAVEQEIIHQAGGSIQGMMVDISQSKMTPAVSSRGRKLVDNIHAAGVTDYPTAVVGGTTLQKTVVSAIGIFRRDVFTADTREAGLAQLVNYLRSETHPKG